MRKTILIADDEPNIITLVKLCLDEMPFDIISADNGVEAMRLISTQKIDLILLDVMMPSINGFEVCRRIRQELKLTTPIVFLSAKAQNTDIRTGLGVGADEYLTKPFEPEDLRELVRKYLK